MQAKTTLKLHLTPVRKGNIKAKIMKKNAGMYVGKVEHFYSGGRASGCRPCGHQCDCFLKKLEINRPYAQLCHCWAYTQRIVYPSTEAPAQQCLLESVAI